MPSLTRRSRLDGREIGQSPTSRWELGHLNLLVVLAGGSVTLWLLSKTTIFDWIMKRFMQWAVNRWMQITVSDYAELLILSGDFVVTDLEIEDQEMRSQERREAEYPIAARGMRRMTTSDKKIGLALGGGAVLGASHLGVLRALDEYDITIDMIAGTSIGAFVAALYSFGRTWEEIKDMVLDLEWLDVYRITLSKYALLSNEKLGALLMDSIGSVRLEEAEIPLAVVATDVADGAKVVLTEGSVADAVMASSCIPGVFEPIEIDGRLLVDGGVVENVPLTPLRDMGADFLIAAQLSTTPKEKPDNIIQVLVNSFTFVLKAATDLQVEEADLILRPDLTEFSMFDTSHVDELIDVGYEEAKANLTELRG